MRSGKILEGVDRTNRWRSLTWRRFVRSLPCGCADPRCPNCDPARRNVRVVAAHLRSMEGVGIRPDDFLIYPLSDSIHCEFHNSGHPSVAWQLNQVARTLRAGFKAGVLKVDPNPETTITF